jgi:hypothetical protein
MPTIKLTVPQKAWNKEEKAKIVERFTEALNTVAKESGKGDIKQFINVHIPGLFHSQGSLKMLEFQASSNGSSVYASASDPHPCCYRLTV